MNLKWDYHSDQPHVIRDRALKKRIYKQVRWDSFKLILTNIIFYPISVLFYLLVPSKKRQVKTEGFFGMSINLDKNPEQTKGLIDDLGVNNLLIRVPLSDIDNLQSYLDFASEYKDKNLLINILQDRRHIEDLALSKDSLSKIFEAFLPLTNRFQVGNAINRKKWAIFSMDEFLSFYKVAYDLKKKQYPSLVLLGASVIDFEYYFTLRTLFNFKKVRYDECSTLLYVDRRGAPENMQMGLDLRKKLALLQSMLRLSPKSGSDIVVTETNWPITQTAPYAPTSEDDCVTLDEHADYLVRYYMLALATGVVKNVYWHQLIAPGYGLIDNRGNELIKYPAYQAFRAMLFLLQGAKFIRLEEESGLYKVVFKKDSNVIKVVWSLEKIQIKAKVETLLNRDGEKVNSLENIEASGSPIYLISKELDDHI